MRRILTASLLVMLSCAVYAQESKDRSWTGLNETTTLWASSNNAAGLAFAPYKEYNTLRAVYDWQNGDWRPMQTGTTVSDIQFDTHGAKQIGRIQLWGRFSYDNVNDRGSSFNTLLYNPFDERFMYTAADTVSGQWKKQCYDMQVKAALPLGEHFSTGIDINYIDRIAASQIDPRAESYNYSVVVKPGIVWKAGSSLIGFNGLYSNTFERSTPSISNSQEIQKVFLLRGLGNWVGEQVGSGGLSTMYFRCNTWGAALQYALQKDWQLHAELSYQNHSTRTTESATQPKPHGNTLQHRAELNIAALWGERFLHKLTLDASLARTSGTEITALWNTAGGEWEIMSELNQCHLGSACADLLYDCYIKDEHAYKMHLRGGLGTELVRDSYASPYSEFRYSLLSATIAAEYKFHIGKGTLLAGSTVKAFKNLGDSRYSYNGHRAGTAPVRDLYPHNLAVRSADRIQGTLSAEYAFPVSKIMNLAFCAECTATSALCLELGTLRRIEALGAVKLYF